MKATYLVNPKYKTISKLDDTDFVNIEEFKKLKKTHITNDIIIRELEIGEKEWYFYEYNLIGNKYTKIKGAAYVTGLIDSQFTHNVRWEKDYSEGS